MAGKKKGFSGGVVTVACLEYQPGTRNGKVGWTPPGTSDAARPIKRLLIEPKDSLGGPILFAKGSCGNWAYAADNEAEMLAIAQFICDYLGKDIVAVKAKVK